MSSNFQLFFFILFITSCQYKSELNPKEMVKWFEKEKSSFIHEKTVGPYQFRLKFMPSEIKILSEVDHPNLIEEKYYNERYNELKDKIFCFFEIIPIKNEQTLLETETLNAQEYGSRLNYFVSFAQQDFYMVQGKDTMKCLTYHFENTYGLKKSNTISMLFDKKNNKQDIEFVFDDKILNTGPIIFTQKSFSDLKTPIIKFN